jgi:hypothetical protein
MVRLFLRIWLMESPASCADAPFESLRDPSELFMKTDPTFRVRSGFARRSRGSQMRYFWRMISPRVPPAHQDKKPCKSRRIKRT